jgi:hypothetical protein
MIYAIVLIILAGLSGSKSTVCSADPVLAALLVPKQPGAGRYEVCTTPDSIDVVLAEALGLGTRFGPVEAVDPLDAFGTAGRYERSTLSRLFGGRRARVAHGWSTESHGLVSVTLVSPHPNRTFTALVSGTLVIRYVLESRGL